MKRYSWLTDVHFDYFTPDLEDRVIVKTTKKCLEQNVDGIIVTGDITVGPKLVKTLSIMDHTAQIPILFVLGNHDTWFSSFDATRKQMTELSSISPYLKYVSVTDYVPLTQGACLVGHDGCYDGYVGDPLMSRFFVNDWENTHDYKQVGGMANRGAIVSVARSQARLAAEHVAQSIKRATRYYRSIYVITHVPPFVEACKFGPGPVESDAAPWYCDVTMGTMLRRAADAYKGITFTVLCGHSHTGCTYRVSDNMVCIVGQAEYGTPRPQDLVIEVQ